MRRWRKKMSKRSGRLSYCEDFLSRCSRTDRMSCRSSASLDPPSSHLRHLSCVCSQTVSPWTWALNKRQTGGIILYLCETLHVIVTATRSSTDLFCRRVVKSQDGWVHL